MFRPVYVLPTLAFAALSLAQDPLAQWFSPDAEAQDAFGSSLSLDGGTLLVGAPGGDSNGQDSGAAYLLDAQSGALCLTLTEADAGAGNAFGFSVAQSGGCAIIGSPFDDELATDAGSASVVDLTTGVLLYELLAAGGGSGDTYGHSVDIQGGMAIVGAPLFGLGDRGIAYVYDVATGLEITKLRPDIPHAGDQFGLSVALSGDLALVGAPREDSFGFGSGAAYLFVASTGEQLFMWTASNALFAANFGEAVALDGTTALIGAPFHVSGLAYVFDALSGLQTQILMPANSVLNQRFGSSLTIQEGVFESRAVVGSGNGGASGHVFDARNGTELGQLTAGSATLTAGPQVEIDGERIYVSSPLDASVALFDAPALPIPFTYCTAKPSSIGCLAQISTSNAGAQPVSGASDYSVTASVVHAFKIGLLFASVNGSTALPFLGGTLCVQPPIAKRGPLVASGGTLSDTCTGSFTTLINDGQPLLSNIANALDGGPGTAVWYQYWYRDPANGPGTLGTALSNAVRVDFQ